MPGSLGHLSKRFFDVLLSRDLTKSEADAVRGWLSEEEAEVFFQQPRADRRHGYAAALSITATGRGDMGLVRAALLHDVGKRHAQLGLPGRVTASVLIRLRIPLRGRAALYRDHGKRAEDELRALGCEPLVVEFARHHHGPRPDSIPPEDWGLLQYADRPAKVRLTSRPGIS